ncbi:MAG TPA: hypothetical protein VNT99_12340 [Methylomirabilota bacterium]|nr:hypothetical protein [Methylomirabilota bacterium]
MFLAVRAGTLVSVLKYQWQKFAFLSGPLEILRQVLDMIFVKRLAMFGGRPAVQLCCACSFLLLPTRISDVPR